MEIKRRKIEILLFFVVVTIATLFLSTDLYIEGNTTPKWDGFSMTVSCGIMYLIWQKNFFLQIDTVTVLLFAVIMYLLSRSLVSRNFDYELCYYVLFVALYFVSKSWKSDYIPHIFLVGAVAQSIFGIEQFCTAERGEFPLGIVGSFDNPAGYTSCLALIYPLGFILLKRSCIERTFALIAMGIIVVGILLSGYRTAILSITVVTIIYVLASINRRKLVYIATSIILFLGVVGTMLLVKTDSIHGRLLIWRVSASQMLDNLIFGNGYRSFRTDYMSEQGNYFAKNPDSQYAQLADNVRHPFNEYIQLIIEYGLVGLLLLLLLLVFLLIKCQKSDPYFLCLISLAIFSFFSYPFSYPFTLVMVAFCLGKLSDNFPGYRINLYRGRYSVPIFMTLVISMLILFNDMKSEIYWKKVYINSYLGNRENVIKYYDHLSNNFYYKAPFYYSYAVELKRDGFIDSSLVMIERCKESINDYDVNNLLGELYIKKKNYQLAEYYFKIAENMIPNRFHPLSRLLHLYDLSGQKKKAVEMAEEILTKKVKISSRRVIEIQDEAEEYLKKNCIKI